MPPRVGRAARSALCSLLAIGASGCFLLDRPAVGVDRVGPELVDQQLNANALTGTQPSASTLEVLHFYGLRERYGNDPEAALVELHHSVVADPRRAALHALSELSYLRGKKRASREHFLAAAVYAYLYLLGEPGLEPASPYDRRFRWACDLYNRGLRAACAGDDGELHFEAGRRALPIGSLEVSVDLSSIPFDASGARFLSADDFSVWGLSLRQRDSGLGTPLIAKLPRSAAADLRGRFREELAHAPATAFLRVEGSLAELESGLSARLELHSAFAEPTVSVGERSIPLEADASATLAYALDQSSVWRFGRRGLFRVDETSDEDGLFMVRPHQPGLVPVVFVHGTGSNPAYWAEMFNLLQTDPLLRSRTQFWFFQYSTGSPIPVSAAKLRAALLEFATTLDPQGKDEALRNLVVIGHSQGGLLAKLMGVDGDLGWWERLAGTPLSELTLPDEQRALITESLDFDPLPFVTRLVYVCTPHRGSFLADKWYAGLFTKMISLPREMTELGTSLLQQKVRMPEGFRDRIPTSLENMKASSPFLQLLGETPLAEHVTAHSIIAIGRADPAHPEGADDGVVEFESAHVDGVASEYLVNSGHSCQANPLVIREVRRILLEHLADLPHP